MKKVLLLATLAIVWAVLWANAPKSAHKKSYQRIVALAPSYCETIEALDLAHLVVGVSSHCQSPAFLDVAKVGSFAEPNFEAILAQKPDLVLAVPHPMAKNLLDRLSLEGIETYAEQPDSLKNIEQITLDLAKKLGVKKQGEKLVEQLKTRLSLAKKLGLNQTFLIAFSPSPLVVAGKNTFPSEILEALGLKNMATKQAWPIWPLESLLKDPPDILLLADGHESLPLYKNLFNNLLVDQKMILAPDRPLFNSPSPKLLDDINYISELLNHRHARRD